MRVGEGQASRDEHFTLQHSCLAQVRYNWSLHTLLKSVGRSQDALLRSGMQCFAESSDHVIITSHLQVIRPGPLGCTYHKVATAEHTVPRWRVAASKHHKEDQTWRVGCARAPVCRSSLTKCSLSSWSQKIASNTSRHASRYIPDKTPGILSRCAAICWYQRAYIVQSSSIFQRRLITLACAQQERTGVPAGVQRLIYGGRELDEDHTVMGYGLEPGSTIHLVLRLRGGKGGFGSLLRSAGTIALCLRDCDTLSGFVS